MTYRTKRTGRRILGIAPSSRGFGYGVLEGGETLVDWGVGFVSGDKNVGTLKKVAAMIAHYKPSVFRTRPTRKMGGKPLCHSAIYQIFTKPFYYGWFEYPSKSGQWYQGRHEPLITEAEYDRVQVLLGRVGNPRPKTHPDFAFTGLIRCGDCASMVTAEEKHQLICYQCSFKFAYRNREDCPRCLTPIEKMTGATFLHYSYYHCTAKKRPRCSQKSVRAEELEEQITRFLERIEISPRFKDWALKYLHELHEKESSARNDIIQTQQKAYRDCLRRIDNLVILKTSSGNADGSLLSDEEYGRQRVALLKEKAALEELLRDAGHRVEQWLKLSEQTFEFACAVRDRFTKGDAMTKKEILTTIGSGLILKDKKLFIEAKKPFFILENSLTADEAEIGPVERENIAPSQARNVSFISPRPSVLRGLGDVRTLKHRNQHIAKSIYAFYRKFQGTPYEIFPSWSRHEHSLKDRRN